MKGFTIVELLLSVAIVGILAATVTGFSLFFLRSNDLELALSATSQTLRRAQTLSRAGADDAPWGVKLQNGSLTLFQGSSYANRNATLDELLEIPSTITLSGVTEMVYTKTTGLPTLSGVITLTHDVIGARRLFVNSIGTIEEVASSTVTLTANRDATLVQNSSATNFGGTTTLEEYPRNNGYNKRAMVWFNLSTIPSSAQITSAVINLKETQTYGTTRTIALHRVVQSWNETTVTWNTTATQYNAAPTASATLSWTGTLKWDQWNVTSDVQSVVNGSQSNFGWIIKDANEDLSEAYWYFSSREGADPPTLTVTYAL